MDTLLDSLPDRPLNRDEALAICNHDVVEWGAAPATDDDGNVYTFILVFDDTAYGIGHDETDGTWGVIHSVDRSKTGAVDELDTEMNRWAERLYGERSDDLAPDLPDIDQYR